MALGRLALALVLSCGAACGREWRPVDARALRETKPRTLALAVGKRPPFTAHTYGGLVLGILLFPVGMLVNAWRSQAEGNQIVKRNAVGDPARKLGLRLAEAFARQNGLTRGGTRLVWGRSLPGRDFDADLVLFARTKSWGVTTASGGYKVLYEARIELHDLRQQRIVAAGECEQPPRGREERPGYTQLLADRAAFVKRRLAYAAELCLREFASGLLGSTDPISLERDDAASEPDDEVEDQDADEEEDGEKAAE